MKYEAFDRSVEAWAEAHALTLFQQENARFCYTSSERGECFQLVVRDPLSKEVLIEAFSIETLHDEEIHKAWTVPLDGISGALDEAWHPLRTGNEGSEGRLKIVSRLWGA